MRWRSDRVNRLRRSVTWKRRHGPTLVRRCNRSPPLIISARYFASAATNPCAFAATVSALSPGVDRRPNAEPCGAGGPPGRDIGWVNPAHRQHCRPRRQHRTQRTQHGWTRGLGRKQLQRIGACGQHGERLRRREEPRHRQQSVLLRRSHDRRIRVWCDDQPAAGGGDLRDLVRRHDSACPDQQPFAEFPRQRVRCSPSAAANSTVLRRLPRPGAPAPRR